MKTMNSLQTREQHVVGDEKALSSLGIASSDIQHFQQRMQGAVSNTEAIISVHDRRKELMKEYVRPLTRSQWKRFFRDLGLSEGAIGDVMWRWAFDEDGWVTAEDSIGIHHQSELTMLPPGLKKVVGYAGFSFCGFESLKHMPLECTKALTISDCNFLTTLEGLEHSKVQGLKINDCVRLVSLKGCPMRIEESLSLEGCCSLESLEYLPKYIGFNLNLRFCSDFDAFPEDVEVQGEIIVSHMQKKLIEILKKQGRAIEIIDEDEE